MPDCIILMAHLGQGTPVVYRVAEVRSAWYLKALTIALNSAQHTGREISYVMVYLNFAE